jgi:hypothetical protein
MQEEVWTGDHLEFRVSALGQGASGSIDVAEDHVRLEILLPWLLAQLGEKVRPLTRNQGLVPLGRGSWPEDRPPAAGSRKAASDQRPMPFSGSGVMLVE